nr:A disintegrin and metalloproteinase with thrombospondin motifs 7-like [Cherax quadricarinatus]
MRVGTQHLEVTLPTRHFARRNRFLQWNTGDYNAGDCRSSLRVDIITVGYPLTVPLQPGTIDLLSVPVSVILVDDKGEFIGQLISILWIVAQDHPWLSARKNWVSFSSQFLSNWAVVLTLDFVRPAPTAWLTLSSTKRPGLEPVREGTDLWNTFQCDPQCMFVGRIIQWSGEYSADGTMMYYTRDGEAEELFLPGPVKRPLTLMLLFQTENPGLAWEYTLPQHDVTYTPTFTWLHSDWSVCTVTCGEGTQVSKVQCMEKEAGLVEEQYCRGQQKPSDRSRACNKHACPAWWWSGPWQPCAITCGSGGVRRRTVICVRSFGPTQQMALLDSACDDSDKPHETEVCPTLPPCPQLLEWSVGAWSQSCTLDPCDFEEREVLCVAPGENCDPLSRPPDRRQCGNLTCGVWQVGSWSKCSSPCGEGVQFRPVSCEGGLACREIDEPKSVQECIGNCLDDETHLEINDDLMDELLSLSISAVTTPKGILATTPGVTSTTTPASISSTTPVNISSATPTGTFSTSLVDISTTTPGSISSTTLSHTISTTPTDIPSTISVDISTMAPESISSTTPAGMFSTIREVIPSSNPGSISTMTPLGTSSTTISSPTLGSASSTTKVGVFSTSASTNILPTTSTPPHTSTSLTTSTVLSITTAAVPTFHTVSLTSESSSTEPASYDLPLPPIITTPSTSNEASTSEALATAPTIEFSNFYPTDETTVEVLRSSTTIPSKNSRSKTLITQPETMTDPPSTTASVFTSLPVVDSNTPETTTASVSTGLPVADSNIPETSTTASVFTSLPVEKSNIPETSTIKLVSTSLPVAGSNILETSITASVSTSLPVKDSNIPETSTTTSETSTTFISTSLPVADSNIPETLTTVSIPTGLPAADSSIPETTTVAPVSGPTTALLPVKYSPEIGTLANGEVAEKRYSVEDDHEASKVAFEDNDRADNDMDDTTDAAAQKLNSTLSEDNIENIQKDKAASFKENMSDAHDTLGDTVSETLPETDHENIHVLESFSEVDVESKTLKPEDKMVLNNRSSAEEKLPDGEIHPESQIPDNTQVSASPTSADDDLKTGEAPLVTEAPTQMQQHTQSELSSELEESTEEEEVEAEEQRPDGIIEDKINVDDFEVIEILELPPKTNGKKHRKKVLLHSGAKAVDVLYELAEEQAAKKAATTFLPNNSLDNMVPKYQWNISNWSECSVECGGGKQLRSVTCQDLSSNTPVHPQLCILPAPQNVQSCNTVECGEWRVGEWSACSSLCELGERVRSVECVEGERCLSHTRPTEVEACNLGPCVQWVEGPWSLCTK